MDLSELLDRLGYADSGNFLRQDRGDFDHIPDYGHLFRQAARQRTSLQGVYALREGGPAAIPVVYVCEVGSENAATEVHRLIWNQDAVPFVIVKSPATVRVYPGFCYTPRELADAGATRVTEAFAQAKLDRIAETLSATAVDAGEVWRFWGRHVLPRYRLDRRLLESLRRLGAWLQRDGRLRASVAHALIGQYVFLNYLRDRDILPNEKLAGWGIDCQGVFGPNANRGELRSLLERLEKWLNGKVFPIDFDAPGAPSDKHVARVAATFEGDQPEGAGAWQLHLDFQAYDFSYIPIELLSAVYEQFLHAPGKAGKQGEGRSKGAYYTPIPVVNLMLSELEERLPLKRGMRVFDPACGSGAFLVQGFRRLIEKAFPPSGASPKPEDLRDLVKGHFFGLDTDEDACGVARLSLILTLLDYVQPKDLSGGSARLPDLRQNIIRANFFDESGPWRQVVAKESADWVVGNPPWKRLKRSNLRDEDKAVLAWIKAEEKSRPVCNRQMARAFAWRAAEYVSDKGEVAMFLPAMTFFEKATWRFRKRFFKNMVVHTVVNFSNLRKVISGGRFTHPASAVFYRPRRSTGPQEEQIIRTYSPLFANQEATRPQGGGAKAEAWNIVINGSEVVDLPWETVADGQATPWKIAAWGSQLDARLMRRLSRRYPSIEDVQESGHLVVREGPQLFAPEKRKEGMTELPDLLNYQSVDAKVLKGLRHFFVFPGRALRDNTKPLLRQRGGRVGLDVCEPPHVLVGAACNFAVYSEDPIVVSSRQIGIISPHGDTDLLKALALFLNSDFALYFEFFNSTTLGVERGRSNLEALRRLPMPLLDMPPRKLRKWTALHGALVRATACAYARGGLLPEGRSGTLPPPGFVVGSDLLDSLNALVYEALDFDTGDIALVRDLVHVRLALNDGQMGQDAIRRPTPSEMTAYAERLRDELDGFVEGQAQGRHVVEVLYEDTSSMVRIRVNQHPKARQSAVVCAASSGQAAAFKECRRHLRQVRSQWVYFDRNLRVYDGADTYILKPMQRFHWTETQARVDATAILAESIARRSEP
jgi:hypothetical protein